MFHCNNIVLRFPVGSLVSLKLLVISLHLKDSLHCNLFYSDFLKTRALFHKVHIKSIPQDWSGGEEESSHLCNVSTFHVYTSTFTQNVAQCKHNVST